MAFLENFGPIPPANVGMTNDLTLKVGLKFGLEDLVKQLPGPIGALIKKFVDELDFSMLVVGTATTSGAEFEIEVVLKFPSPFGPEIIEVGVGRFTIKLGSDFGFAVDILIGVGVGVKIPLGVGKLLAYYAETQFVIFGDVFGLGVGAILKGSIDLKIVSVEVTVEAKIALLKVSCNAGADTTVWAVAQVTFALEVTVAFVVDIDFEEQAQWQHDLDSGPCPLPDVV